MDKEEAKKELESLRREDDGAETMNGQKTSKAEHRKPHSVANTTDNLQMLFFLLFFFFLNNNSHF